MTNTSFSVESRRRTKRLPSAKIISTESSSTLTSEITKKPRSDVLIKGDSKSVSSRSVGKRGSGMNCSYSKTLTTDVSAVSAGKITHSFSTNTSVFSFTFGPSVKFSLMTNLTWLPAEPDTRASQSRKSRPPPNSSNGPQLTSCPVAPVGIKSFKAAINDTKVLAEPPGKCAFQYAFPHCDTHMTRLPLPAEHAHLQALPTRSAHSSGNSPIDEQQSWHRCQGTDRSLFLIDFHIMSGVFLSVKHESTNWMSDF